MEQEQEFSKTICLLIVAPVDSNADSIVNVFRESGYSVRSSHIGSLDKLDEAYQEIARWDLLIVMKLPEELSLDILLNGLSQRGHDLPVVFISDYQMPSERLSYLNKGVSAVVPSGNMEMLLILSIREIENVGIRRRYRRLCVSLEESEKHRRLLLDNQNYSIAYVREGIIQYANSAFIKLLGENKSDEVEGKSIIDWVVESEKKELLMVLLDAEKHGERASGKNYHLISRSDNENSDAKKEQAISIEMTPTSYDGHFALSIVISIVESETDDIIDTSLILEEEVAIMSREQLLDRLHINVQQAVDNKGNFTLVYLVLEEGEGVFVGFSSQDKTNFINALGEKLLQVLDSTYKLANLGRGNFALIAESEEEQEIKQLCMTIRQSMEMETIEVGGKKYSANFKMGGVVLRDSDCEAKQLLTRARNACLKVKKPTEEPIVFYQTRKIQIVDSATQHLVFMLQDALENNRLVPLYQPIINLNDSVESYYDIRFKMKDVRGREHYSMSFRSKLEKEAIWETTDQWLFKVLVQSLAKKNKETSGDKVRGFYHPGARSMISTAFPVWMEEVLGEIGLPADHLVVAIHEQHITQDPKAAKVFFHKLEQFGFGRAISNFGCSVHPLENVGSLDPDFIIVDQSYIPSLISGRANIKLKSMLQTLQDKDKKIVATYVETTEGMAELWKQGISYLSGEFIQGYSEIMNYNFHEHT